MSRPVVIRQLRALEAAGLVEWVGTSANYSKPHSKGDEEHRAYSRLVTR
jgi:hypothetical protein